MEEIFPSLHINDQFNGKARSQFNRENLSVKAHNAIDQLFFIERAYVKYIINA